MIDAVMSAVVVILFAGIIAAVAASYPRELRRWIWLAFIEYLVCAGAQLFYARVLVNGGDTLLYARTGAELARMLEGSFGWASSEVNALLLQQPSALDALVIGGGQSNTGSMYAVAAWLTFVLRGETAIHIFMACASLLGALAIFDAFRRVAPETSPLRLFTATVLFPSIAFWTAALHKEALAIVGLGALLTAWRSLYERRWLRVIVLAPLGLTALFLFRAPMLPPLLLGLAVFAIFASVKKLRGVDSVVLGPIYFGLAVGVLAIGMVVLSRLSPALALDKIGETVAQKQETWALSRGGSSLADVENAPLSVGGQLARVPLALFNALFRPQLFDVNNFGALISALEMTTITWLLIRALRTHGASGMISRIQRSPFLLMCAVTTLVGSAFVGLVTLNFGSLARYRVPFLPFYGALVAILSAKPIVAPVLVRTTTARVRRTVRSRRSVARAES